MESKVHYSMDISLWRTPTGYL